MRKCKDWIRSYIEYVQFQESPPIFHLWSAISVIAATLNRQTYMDMFYFKPYTNQYIILIAESAMSRKSTAVNTALHIFNSAFPKQHIASKKVTIESFIKTLGDKSKKTGEASIYLYSTELSVLIGDKINTALLNRLTELYDCPDFWDNETKTAGIDNLKNVCINFIACTTPKDLCRMPEIMISGGFGARALFIVSSQRGKPECDPKSKVQNNPLILTIKENLIHDLKLIKKIKGEYTFSRESKKFYEMVYNKNFHRKIVDERLHPFQGRLGEHILSIAIILESAKTDSLIISFESMQESVLLLKQVERDMPEGLNYIDSGGNTIAKSMKRCLHLIVEYSKKKGRIPHTILLQQMGRRTNAQQLMAIIEHLKEEERIEEIKVERQKFYMIKKTFNMEEIS